ncbi:FAD-dependent oxidoreductase [Halopelagius longus]|uniref:Pyridine nucleotide-disulphide oxidoreductase n=1 Tax=Halopelagius longus TaxID=1236180 RepID=A0A1H1A980_9EURY|nr:FAD-dependent oxidoreductase [Halopelagius longus]RDI70287.1 thioredoxin reductase [Halopelagius longus]SDQ36194.1 Pyridine nucleotide-disulphide oxidoreductase [Halopelagius longus]
MVRVAVVGGGPAGMGAALYTAKNDLETVVFDTDETWMHKARLWNYPGIEEIGGTELVERMRDQSEQFGAEIHQTEVTDVESTDKGFTVTTDDDEEHEADYLVLATGANRDLAEQLGCEFTDEGVVDATLQMETSVEDAYATGAMVRPEEWQANIATGDGSAAALHILSKEKGEHFHDFDVPDDAE